MFIQWFRRLSIRVIFVRFDPLMKNQPARRMAEADTRDCKFEHVNNHGNTSRSAAALEHLTLRYTLRLSTLDDITAVMFGIQRKKEPQSVAKSVPIDSQSDRCILFRTSEPISVCLDKLEEALSLLFGRRAGG